MIPLTWNEAVSGISGSVSLAAWIFLLVPQLVENYKQGSADGISLIFLFIWFVGDVTNLIGAVWAGLVPTVIALAIYFCFADAVLISQCLYYNALNRKKDTVAIEEEEASHQNEETPLLNGGPSTRRRKRSSFGDAEDLNLGLPGSRRRSTASSKQRRQSTNSLERILEEPTRSSAILKNSLSVVLIIAAGAAGWAVAWQTGAWKPTPLGNEGQVDKTPVGASVLGYISAVCYLGARIPQIIKNQRERSCDGLSLLFFLLSLLGNATYGAGILFHSVEKQYFMTNLPWLIGSLGTMAEDAIIFVQFSAFGEKESAVEE